MGFYRSQCHSFSFPNMRFAGEALFVPIDFCKNTYFHGNFVTLLNFFFFYSHIRSLGKNKFLLPKNDFSLLVVHKRLRKIN